MRALIDSHIFLHMLGDPDRLSVAQRAIVEDPENDLLLSLAAVWEITIKYSLGKLRLPAPPEVLFPTQLDAFGVELLPITIEHVLRVGSLPHHHGDPFDRIMIAQSLLQDLSILSSDQHFPAYGVHVVA